MFKKIKYMYKLETLTIKIVIEDIWEDVKSRRSIGPVIELLNPYNQYTFEGGVKQGNYYTFVRDMLDSGYCPLKRRNA